MSSHSPLAAASSALGMPQRRFFVAGIEGQWRMERVTGVVGEGLPQTARLSVVRAESPRDPASAWVLRATTSNLRYTDLKETNALGAVQEGLGRPNAVNAAFIAIRKSAAWWALAQDERRAIFEEQSHHIGIGLDYLPDVARQLYHSRDLGEPFDFLTWFEYAPKFASAFDRLLDRLRATKEWTFVEREVDIRLIRCPTI